MNKATQATKPVVPKMNRPIRDFITPYLDEPTFRFAPRTAGNCHVFATLRNPHRDCAIAGNVCPCGLSCCGMGRVAFGQPKVMAAAFPTPPLFAVPRRPLLSFPGAPGHWLTRDVPRRNSDRC